MRFCRYDRTVQIAHYKDARLQWSSCKRYLGQNLLFAFMKKDSCCQSQIQSQKQGAKYVQVLSVELAVISEWKLAIKKNYELVFKGTCIFS